jgi:hypothetical protein
MERKERKAHPKLEGGDQFMELSIIHRVAQIINSHKVDAAMGLKKSSPSRVSSDTVDLSSVGSDINTVKARLDVLPDRDPERQDKIDKIKDAVEQKKYALSEDILNSIAEKIANSFM